MVFTCSGEEEKKDAGGSQLSTFSIGAEIQPLPDLFIYFLLARRRSLYSLVPGMVDGVFTDIL